MPLDRAQAQAMPAHSPQPYAPQGGFTLLEIVVSMTIFAVIVVGTAGLLAASAAGGFLDTFPTALAATHLAKDLTAASSYLQALQEFMASRPGALTAPGSYCLGSGCEPAEALADAAGLPLPPSVSSQLRGARLLVDIQRWHWNPSGPDRYCLVGTAECATTPAGDYLTHVRATLTWQSRGTARTLTVEQVLP